MAGDSEKRIKREAAIYTNYYNIALFLVNCIYLLAVLYDWENFGFWTICGIAFFSAVNYVCYRSVISALNNGIETGYFNDLLLVNLFVQVTTCYSSLFWVFYLLIPGYFMYDFVLCESLFVDINMADL